MRIWSAALCWLALCAIPAGAAAQAEQSATPQWHRDGGIPDTATVATRLARCGVEGASVGFDEIFQEEVFVFPADQVFDDAQVRCLAQVSFDTGYFIVLPELHQAQFLAVREVLERPWVMELSRQFFEERGRLDDLPVRSGNQTAADFARELEAFCGPLAAGALSSVSGPNSLDPAWLHTASESYSDSGETMLCLMHAGIASGFETGLVGNEEANGPSADAPLATPRPGTSPG